MTLLKFVVVPAMLLLGGIAVVDAGVDWLRAWWSRRHLQPCTLCAARPVGVSPRGGCLWADGSDHCFARFDEAGKRVAHVCTRCALRTGIVRPIHLTPEQVRALLDGGPVVSSSVLPN